MLKLNEIKKIHKEALNTAKASVFVDYTEQQLVDLSKRMVQVHQFRGQEVKSERFYLYDEAIQAFQKVLLEKGAPSKLVYAKQDTILSN